MSNKKSMALRTAKSQSLTEMSQVLGVSVQVLSARLKDHAVCKYSIAVEMQAKLGISHQFFMYPYPTCMQFLGDKK